MEHRTVALSRWDGGRVRGRHPAESEESLDLTARPCTVAVVNLEDGRVVEIEIQPSEVTVELGHRTVEDSTVTGLPEPFQGGQPGGV